MRRLIELSFLLLSLVAAIPAGALGQRLDPIVPAEKLIKEQKYNEAVAYLSDFIRKYPERFDEAQALIRTVIQNREAYNKVADELLKAITQDPENKELQVELTLRLEALDPYPNQATQEFVYKTKLASLFFVNKTLFDRIMDEGRAFLDQKQYALAARKYEEGFILYRKEFEQAGYDAMTVSSVYALVDVVKLRIAGFESAQEELVSTVAALRSAFAAGDEAAVARLWPAVETLLVEQGRRRNAAVAAGKAMARQFETLQKIDPELSNDSSYLPFARRFTLGRENLGKDSLGNVIPAPPEGVMGSMDLLWTALLDSLQAAFEPQLEKIYSAAEEDFDAGRWAEAESGFERAASLAGPAIGVLALWSFIAPTDMLPVPTRYGRNVLVSKPGAYERARALALSAAASARLAGYAAQAARNDEASAGYLAALPARPPLDATLARFSDFRGELRDLQARLEAEREESRKRAEENSRWTAAGWGDQRTDRAQGSFDGRLKALLDRSLDFEVALAARILGVEFADLEYEYGDRKETLARGRLLLEGEVATDPALGGAILRYPTRTAESMAEVEPLLRALRSRIAEYLVRMGREIPYVAGAAPVQVWAEKSRQLDREALALQTERGQLLARAQEQRRQAELAKAEAERRFAEARAALEREDFETARDRLGRARDRYFASLSFENDARLRLESDQSLSLLGADIVRAENDKVVRDTRAFINEGKDLYFKGSFDKAEEALTKARARWKTTHDEPEPEVEYWMRLVTTALSVKTGRDIPTTAPLYPEMSQTLSLAKKYYEQGARLLEQRNKSDALQYFALARAKIKEVQVVYPLNQEAGVLDLRIDQLIDPGVFPQNFKAKFDQARARIESNPREAYAQLQDLAAINAKYPGLAAAMDRAAIAAGYKAAPIDQTKVRQAATLVAEARRIYDAREAARYEYALEQLNKAIQFDPNNKTAADLKDRIGILVGGTASIVMTAAAEEQYQRAVALFQSGDIITALEVVTTLLKDPKNQRFQKILDLKSKLEARL
jgi:hypothetical protein